MAQESSEAEMPPPLTAVQKLGVLVNEHAIEPEDYLPPYVQSAYYRLTEAGPSVSRETIARGLGLVSVAQLSELESTIVSRFSRLGPETLTASEAFQQLAIERKEEHSVLAKAQPFTTRKPIIFGDESDTELEPPPKSKAPPKSKPPRRPSPPGRTTHPKPKKKAKEDTDEAIDVSIRTAARILTERSEDPLILLKGKPGQQALYWLATGANLAADQAAEVITKEVHRYPAVVRKLKVALLGSLYEAAPHILGFAEPPAPEPKPEPKPKPLPKPVPRRAARPSPVLPKQPTPAPALPGRPGAKGYLREALQQIDTLFARHKADPSNYIGGQGLTAYKLFVDPSKDDKQIRDALGLSADATLTEVKQLLREALMRKAAHLLAFPEPWEPQPPRPPHTPQPQPPPGPKIPSSGKGYIREALYQIDGLFKKHAVDPVKYLNTRELRAYQLLTDKTVSDEEAREALRLPNTGQLMTERFLLRNTLMRKVARWLAFPKPPPLSRSVAPKPAENVSAPKPRDISHRSTLKQMDAILRRHDIDPVDLIHKEFNPKIDRIYIALVATNSIAAAIAAEVGVHKSYIHVLNRKFITELADERAPHILRFATAEDVVLNDKTTRRAAQKDPNVWPALPAGTAAAELNNMLSIGYGPGRVHLIQELAALTGQREFYVERFLNGETHHLPAVLLEPCLDFVKADADARNRIEMLYDQERQVKIARQKAGKAQMWADRHAQAEARKPKEEPEEPLPPTALQQLGALLLQHGLPIEKYVPTDLLSICKILGDTAISRRQLQRDHHLNAGTIATIEAHIIKNMASALPPQITESDDFRYIEMIREAEAGELRTDMAAPASPSSLSLASEATARPHTAWADGERRKVMQRIDLILREAGHDPVSILKQHPSTGQDPRLFEKLYPLLVNPDLTTKEIRRKMGFSEHHQLTHGTRHTWSALMRGLPADVVIDVEEIRHSLKSGPEVTPEKVKLSAGPGQQLSQLRRQLKQERGDAVSIENLAAAIGVSRSALQKFLRDDSHPPSGHLLVPLAHLLGVDKATIEELAQLNDAIAAAKYEQAQTGRREKLSKGNK